MKTRNKVFIGLGAILMVTLLAGYGLSVACGPWADSGRCFRHGFHRDFSGFLLWRMDKRAEELDFNDHQKEKYDEMRSKIEAQFSRGVEDRKKMREEISLELGKKEPDLKILAEAIKKRIAMVSDAVGSNLDLFVEFYNVLDADQQERVLEMIRERVECPGP